MQSQQRLLIACENGSWEGHLASPPANETDEASKESERIATDNLFILISLLHGAVIQLFQADFSELFQDKNVSFVVCGNDGRRYLNSQLMRKIVGHQVNPLIKGPDKLFVFVPAGFGIVI